MTYEDWKETAKIVPIHLAQDTSVADMMENYSHILEHEDGSWIVINQDDASETYYVICGNQQCSTSSLEQAQRFLWDNHAGTHYEDSSALKP